MFRGNPTLHTLCSQLVLYSHRNQVCLYTLSASLPNMSNVITTTTFPEPPFFLARWYKEGWMNTANFAILCFLLTQYVLFSHRHYGTWMSIVQRYCFKSLHTLISIPSSVALHGMECDISKSFSITVLDFEIQKREVGMQYIKRLKEHKVACALLHEVKDLLRTRSSDDKKLKTGFFLIQKKKHFLYCMLADVVLEEEKFNDKTDDPLSYTPKHVY